MTEPINSNFWEEELLESRGIKVGPDPDPQPPEAVHLEVMFSLSDGSTITKWFAIPPKYYPQSMTLSMKRGTKNLGPILRSNFYFHEDSKQLHTICRRESDIITKEDEPPAGPEIDVLEY